MSSVKKIYFFEHAHLRDRHLDTIRNWPAEEVINHDILKRARAGIDDFRKFGIATSCNGVISYLEKTRMSSYAFLIRKHCQEPLSETANH